MSKEEKGPKEYIEAKLKRSGMSGGKREAMRIAMMSVPCTIKCWSCGAYQTAMETEHKTCIKCQKNLWSRNDGIACN